MIKLLWPIFSGQVRTALAAFGGYFVANGYLTDGQWADVSGAIMIVLAALLSATSKAIAAGK